MWAAGELASCRHYSQRQNGGNESFVNVYHQCGGVQLCLFDMKGKCGCKMLRLIANHLADTFTCLSSPSSLPPPLLPLCLFLSSYLESLTEARWLDTPPPSPIPSIRSPHPPPISPRRYIRCGLPAPATPPLSSRG